MLELYRTFLSPCSDKSAPPPLPLHRLHLIHAHTHTHIHTHAHTHTHMHIHTHTHTHTYTHIHTHMHTHIHTHMHTAPRSRERQNKEIHSTALWTQSSCLHFPRQHYPTCFLRLLLQPQQYFGPVNQSSSLTLQYAQTPHQTQLYASCKQTAKKSITSEYHVMSCDVTSASLGL